MKPARSFSFIPRCCQRHPFVFLWLLAIVLTAVPEAVRSGDDGCKSVYEWAFLHLEGVRDNRMEELRRLCELTHEKARAIGADEIMAAFFEARERYREVVGNGRPPTQLAPSLAKFRKSLQTYYGQHYTLFFDVWFVTLQGDILWSIRKHPDYQGNLFTGPLAATPLARALSRRPRTETFVDFHHFAAAQEAAAFFVEPARIKGTQRGWYVLQWSLNKINALFAGQEVLGLSGETFLVNSQGFMLTESSFESDSTILKKHLDRGNIQAKFDAGKGRKTVIDYRGARGLTAFEVYPFLGSRWLVVAKVDEAQVLTAHFIQHPYYYHRVITDHLSRHRQKCESGPVDRNGRSTARVDMDEFVRVNDGEILQTYGVSTCTAFIAAYPGKFGYLAHISPYDKVYGGSATNLAGHVIKKIKTYDIYKYEREQVRFAIVTRHLKSIPNIVDKLLAEGFYLSQIAVFHRPDARSADVCYDYKTDRTGVAWRLGDDGGKTVYQQDCAAQNLGQLLKEAL